MKSGRWLACMLGCLLCLCAANAAGAQGKKGQKASSAVAVDQGCEPSLWTHVYNPTRLQKLTPCVSVSGVVEESTADDDGDQHFLLKLDANQPAGLINKRNIKKKNGDLVVEIVCANPVRLKKVRSACAGYTNKVPLPKPGDHVRVTGTYVIDSHNGWAEVHPASRVDQM